MTIPTFDQLHLFLERVDHDFSVPLSDKQDLSEYTRKLLEKATLCCEIRDGEILSMVAGYTDRVLENRAYIAIVATLPQARGQQLASRLIERFILICQQKALSAVHLYTTPDNTAALRMYHRLGFVDWHLPDEPRPQDTHLILPLN